MIDFNNKKVCIVGNSCSLLKKGFGSAIDAHEYVIRMNRGYTHQLNGKIINFVSLGSRTSYWSCSLHHNFVSAADHFRKVPCIYVNPKLYNKLPSLSHEAGIITNDIENWKRFRRAYPHDRPSTGLLTLDFVMESCKNVGPVTLVGFDFFKMNSWPNTCSVCSLSFRHCTCKKPGNTIVPHSGESERAYIQQTYPQLDIWGDYYT